MLSHRLYKSSNSLFIRTRTLSKEDRKTDVKGHKTMSKVLGFKSSSFSSKSINLESLIRTAIAHKELSPGAAMQINQYRNGKLTCKERRMVAILDDAIANGCVVPIELPMMTVSYRRAMCATR